MLKYAKIINNETKTCLIGDGTNIDYYIKHGYTQQEVEQSDLDGQWYLSGYAPMKTAEQKAQERQKEFEKDFFLTSLGYIRRKVNMATGDTKDFLCDLLPAITTGITLGQEIPIITYKQPDFTKEFTLEYLESLQEIKIATQQFCTECALQISADFMGQPLVLSE